MTENEKIQFVIDNYGKYTKESFCQLLDVSSYWLRKTKSFLIKEGKIESPVTFPSSRKDPKKIQFILENHSDFSRKELAEKLGETPRWIKRAIGKLIKESKLNPKIEFPEKFLSKENWTPEIRKRAFELRSRYLKTNEDICLALKEEFDFQINPPAFQFWMDRFCCKGWNKQKWCNKYLPRHKLKKLLNKDFRIKDIMDHIKEKYGLYMSEDLILDHVKSTGLLNYKLRRIKDINEKAQSYSKEWLLEKVHGHYGLRGLEEEMGVSKTVIMRRLREENINLIKHRKIWSQSMEKLRDSLLQVPFLDSVPLEDIHQMVLGWLLGDGHLDLNGRFVVNHSLKQLDYLYVKTRILKRYVTNIVTVPRNVVDHIYGGKEQLGISCPGFNAYLKYLNKDGSKNHEKIMSELEPIGWACYFMDDGSFFSNRLVVTIKKAISNTFVNRYIFKEEILKGCLEVEGIDPKYLIPGMAYKHPQSEVGSYWRTFVPEIFDFEIESDFDLCFINDYLVERDGALYDKVIKYYQKRGFPYFCVSEDYLRKEYTRLIDLKAEYFWRNEEAIKYISIGNYVFKHFMKHMVEAKYRLTSPLDSFNNYSTFLKTLEYSLKHNKTVLPDYVHDSLIFFNGGVVGFPCAVAKALVMKFSKKGDIIVDPCAGWGGRLLGTVASERSYFAFEPWKETFVELKNIVSFFDMKNAEIINSDFSFQNAPKSCNLIFTSPPYIDLEIYEKPLNKTEWLKLMKDIFDYAEKALIPGGYLILNLPRYLKALLSETVLREQKPLYFFTSTRKKDLNKAEILYVWSK